ncbi:STAS domain-containing protein [Nocardia tengchongensis]
MTTSTATLPDKTHVCVIGGEIDVFTAPAFRKALFDSLDIGESIVVDMTAVTFFGAAGIEALIAARDFPDHQHSAICVEGPYCVTRILEIVGLATVFDICG